MSIKDELFGVRQQNCNTCVTETLWIALHICKQGIKLKTGNTGAKGKLDWPKSRKLSDNTFRSGKDFLSFHRKSVHTT